MTTVLVAEDNAINRELLREILEARGCTVLEAQNGKEVLDMIAQRLPDLLLMDISMPVLDGYGTIRRIRQELRFRSLPVVAITAYAMQGDREKILCAGFDGYLPKPVDALSLVEKLQMLVPGGLLPHRLHF